MSLTQDLRTLADQLLDGETPDPNSVPKLLGAVMRFLETGNTKPPVREPAPTPAGAVDPNAAELAALRLQVAQLQAQPGAPVPPTLPGAPANPPLPAVDTAQLATERAAAGLTPSPTPPAQVI